MPNDQQPQIQGVPPGVTLEPVQPSSTPSIQGVPAGVTLEPIQQQTQPMVTNSAGETMPADVAARHALTRQGKTDAPVDLGQYQGVSEIGHGFIKEAARTGEGVANLINKVLPRSMEIPTAESTINRVFPEPGGLQKLIAPGSSLKEKELQIANQDTQTQGLGEGIGGFAENLLEFAGGEEALKGLSFAQRLGKLKNVAEFLEANPTIAKAAHFGANVLRSGVVGAAQGGVKGAAEGDASGGAERGAIGGAIGGAGGEVAPVVTQKLGKVLETYAPDLSNAFMKANRKANYLYGKNPGQAIIDEGVNAPRSFSRVGQLENIKGQLDSATDSLDGQIKQILSDPEVASQRLDPIPAIKNTIADAKNYITQQTGVDVPKYIDRLNKLEDSLLTKYDTNGNPVMKYTGNAKMSPADVSDIKKSVGKNTQWNLDKTDPEFQVKAYENGIRKEIYGKLADLIEGAAPEVGPLNARYANAIEAQALLDKQIALEHGSGGWAGAARKGEWGLALGALLEGHPYLAAPVIANRLARSIPGRVLESRGASATGKALQSPALAEAEKKIGVPAIANWIRVQLSDGHTLDVHGDDLSELRKRDPGAKVNQ